MGDVYEICKKLKPIIGKQADCYWLAYLAEDTDGKKEIADTLQLLAMQLLGMDYEDSKVHLTVPLPNTASGEYSIGNVRYADRSLYPFGIRESELIQHIAILWRL